MESIIVPIGICVVLPIAIVLIVSLARINSDNKRSKIIVKAIEANNNIDADKLAESLKKPRLSAREMLNFRLLRGCIYSLIGLVFVVIGLAYMLGSETSDPDLVTASLVCGGVSLAIGLSYLIVYYVTRKQVNDKEE